MGPFNKIRTEYFLEGEGLHVVLNAPKANVLDGEMMGELLGLLDSLRSKPALKLLCFSGEGKHFSFGASVPEHVKEKAPAMLGAFHDLFLSLIDLSIPTAAAVTGQCLGGGMELATFCNRVVASPGAVLGQPEIQLAVLPPIASLILPLRCGQGATDDLVLSGRSVKAPEALDMGVVDVVAEEPRAAVEAWAAEQIAPKSAAALRYAVRTARWHFNDVVKSQIKALEKLYLGGLMETHDANEGLAAFLERRKPEFTGQ